MTSELQAKLAEEFEFMRREPLSADGIIDNLYDAFGIDTGDGWYQLLYDMCREIVEILEREEEPVHMVVDEIKEKYGTLRFYYRFKAPGREDVRQTISAIVQKYEDKSGEICENCGSEGTVRTDPSWIQTLCDACYSDCITWRTKLRERCMDIPDWKGLK